MEPVSDSSLKEYALQFWRRESRPSKINDTIRDNIAKLDGGCDPVQLLKEKHGDKLPFNGSTDCTVGVFSLTEDDLKVLLVHDRIVEDGWMIKNSLVTAPHTNNLWALATSFPSQPWPGNSTQRQKYEEWSKNSKDSALANVMDNELPLIQQNTDGSYEIVDGWGRLLPFSALVQQGYQFYPVQAFVALQK